MTVVWSHKALADVRRLRAFLNRVAPRAAHAAAQALSTEVLILSRNPRIGELIQPPGYDALEVRRILVGDYEVRYQVFPDHVLILRAWHQREDR
ncbi:MAG: plasmid stabilization protein [Candidatus Dactylopiibacterium carminicum]|uniref:Plasmid stabilization protein n=1 Tax=Candidatus Dactylopiibacterium carminicum TaxID=857335 RepID=A0A272EMD2_9RHOO|nr:type II toxin-antitoxin system RelE/ParE family toxin [Candidatus Dactylopiibacterium carminicum]KAF7597663.1 type II toxin-antitoxin system RelE/ParE family toxin [Candidatus Dactylopiibacterium carminicum]PAS91283.1 MAG: plasmid stabilization protein [Candidatus Dactylopiibacterium carminicum]PAS93473.1 MAG: hypothetical protein BSR46_17640 [Candidatus Dactylopiibacterium carminicum]